MEQWEYDSVTIRRPSVFNTAAALFKSREQLVATLNERGEKGWELAHVISGVWGGAETGNYFVIFKRRKP